MSVVDIPRYLLLLARNFNSEKDDSEPSPIKHLFFSLCEQIQERITDAFWGGGSQGFSFIFGEAEFGFFDGSFLCDELISCQDLGFGVVALSR